MADTFFYAQLQPYALYGAGASIGATSITLKSMLDIDGNALTMAGTFGSIGFGTIEPGNGSNEEQISFTGLTNNSNGTVTLTGVKSVSFTGPSTATSGLLKTHAGSTTFVISNTSGFYDKLSAKDDDETITGLWNFPNNANYPTVGTTYVAPTSNLHIATKKYADDLAIAGAPKASTTTYGIAILSTNPVSALIPIAVGDNDGRLPTVAQATALNGNNTDVAVGAGNKYVTQTGLQHSAEKYVAIASSSTTTYVATLSPAPTSYTNGMEIITKIDLANATSTPTLNVNGLGAKTIVKNVNTPLNTGDLAPNMLAKFVYDGTNLVLQNAADTGFLTSGAPGTTVSNATTSVLTYALAGGILGTNRGVRIRFSTSTVNTAVNGTYTVNVKYGGTTISTFGYSGVSGAPTFTSIFSADILLMGSGATGTQRANGIITQLGAGSFANFGIVTQASSSVDSTTSQNIVIELVSSSASVVATFLDYFIQKIV